MPDSVFLVADARSLQRSETTWSDPARRRAYLLRDVRAPISVDAVVCPGWRSSSCDVRWSLRRRAVRGALSRRWKQGWQRPVRTAIEPLGRLKK